MKLLSTAGLLLCPALLLAQVLAPSERLNDQHHEINAFVTDVLPLNTTTVEWLENSDGLPRHIDNWLNRAQYPIVALTHRYGSKGIGYTYHHGRHGFRVGVAQNGSTTTGGKLSQYDYFYHDELEEDVTVSFGNQWEVGGQLTTIKLGYETAMDVHGQQWYAVVEALYQRGTTELHYTSSRVYLGGQHETQRFSHHHTMNSTAIGVETGIGLRLFLTNFLSASIETGAALIRTRWDANIASTGTVMHTALSDEQFTEAAPGGEYSGGILQLLARPVGKAALAVHF